MPSLTIRNIPEDVLERIRVLSRAERRSLNNEILVLLESGLDKDQSKRVDGPQSPGIDVQLSIWDQLCGQWDDKRSAKTISQDIQRKRTAGREVTL